MTAGAEVTEQDRAKEHDAALADKPISRAIVTLYLLQAVNYIFPLLTFPYLVRVLGLEVFGQAQMILSYATLGNIVVDWGFSFTATRAIAKAGNDPTAFGQVVATTLSGKLVLFLLWVPTSVIVGVTLLHPPFGWQGYLLESFLVFSLAITPNWLYQGAERFGEFATCLAVVRAITTAVTFILVKTPSDIAIAVALFGLHGVVASLWLWLRAAAGLKLLLRWPKPRQVVSALSEGTDVFSTQVIVNAYTGGAVLLAGLLGGPQSAGVYAVVDRVVAACKAGLGPVTQVVYARVSGFRSITLRQFLTLTLPPFAGLFALLFVLAVIILSTGSVLFPLIFHVPLERVSPVLTVLVWVLPVAALQNWILPVGLVARGFMRRNSLAAYSGPFVGALVFASLLGSMRSERVVAISVLSIDCTLLLVGLAAWMTSWQNRLSEPVRKSK
jgi:PST family polysaccharide transporter